MMVLAGIVLALAGALYFWQRQEELPPVQPTVSGAAETPAPVGSAGPTTPPIRYPVDGLPADAPARVALPPLSRADEEVRNTLTAWLGKDTVVSFLQLDDFVRHVVATVDNLGRTHAAPRLWPVNSTPGRFSVMQQGDAVVTAPGNAERYAAFVAFVEGIDTRRALALYVRWYPWFQQAYEELGYPGRYFNDRLVEIIDLMLAAPVPAESVALKLTEVKGPIPSIRPWVRYEFADPSLEALTAGQKVMIRVGPAQQQRLRRKLVELRAAVTAAAPPR
jgi:hypothetical protein